MEKSSEALGNMHKDTKENRDLFIGTCKSHSLLAMNTLFKKPPQKMITYQEKCEANRVDNPSAKYAGPPYDL